MEEKMMALLVQLSDGQKQLFESQKQLQIQVTQLFDGQKQLQEHAAQLSDGQKQINERLDRIEVRLDQIETRVDRMENQLVSVDARLDALEQRATKTEVILENQVLPQLQLLAEGHTVLAERLDRMDDTYARKENVEVLQLAVQRHTEEISEIKAAM